MGVKSSEETKASVLRAFDTPFHKRNDAKAAEFWAETYVHHGARIEPGRDGLFYLVRNQPKTLRYENALILAEGDYTMLHGRFTGHGRPRAWIAADMLRMEDGRLAKHWDVLPDEATKEGSRSLLLMFDASFGNPDGGAAPAAAPSLLTTDEARRLIAPLHDALNEPCRKDVAALPAKATNPGPDYGSYSTDEEWLTRDPLGDMFKLIGAAVLDVRWTVEDAQAHGDQIAVRSRATGTPRGELFGAKPTCERFDTMAIDIFTVKKGKFASAYHVENWMEVSRQIGK